MKVVVYIGGNLGTIVSKPMEISKVKSFAKECRSQHIYYERKYSMFEILLILLGLKKKRC